MKYEDVELAQQQRKKSRLVTLQRFTTQWFRAAIYRAKDYRLIIHIQMQPEQHKEVS